MHFFLVVTADPSLGRLDFESLSDQARMEILIAPCSAALQAQYQDEHESFLDVCEWKAVECDENDTVTRISFYLKGEDTEAPNLAYIPPNVTVFRYQGGQPCTFRAEDLPLSLSVFIFTDVLLESTVNFADFPENMQQIQISSCNMQGTCDARNLPKNLEIISIVENALYGSLLLDNLPKRLVSLNAAHNQFSGKLVCDALPPNIRFIILHHNKFSAFALLNLPERTKLVRRPTASAPELHINANSNRISGTAVIEKAVNGHMVFLCLRENYIKSVVDENGKKHRFQKTILEDQIH